MEKIYCETEIKKGYLRTKNAAQSLVRIISELALDDITETKNLYAYTPNKLKFSSSDLINCIKANKKFVRFKCFDDKKPALVARKNGCRVSVDYDEDVLYVVFINTIKIQVSGPEENVKQTRELFQILL